jgi:hypothetical protein
LSFEPIENREGVLEGFGMVLEVAYCVDFQSWRGRPLLEDI